MVVSHPCWLELGGIGSVCKCLSSSSELPRYLDSVGMKADFVVCSMGESIDDEEKGCVHIE